ncbi:hypothetical protein RHMOL_Rhmol02G0243500 [Rhododendron molle]|uniref:Uncharacterized protein n=1 Tax=Rhododendron molle TaxID=49168 RepID=A0ACC0PUZ8_RHOML|nr:hypothetical protein RHMOL_Rhmol02G0243500 [Rhododendron molle]
MLLEELSHFSQQDDESLSQCWKRLKFSVFSWSSFNCELGSLLIIFCRGLNPKPCQVDFRSTDEFLDKSPEDGWDYLDELTQKLQFCELTESSKDTNSDGRGKEEIEPPYCDQLADSFCCNQVENFQVINSFVLEDKTIEPLVTNEIVGSPEVQQFSREHSSTLEMDFHDATPEKSLPIIVQSPLVLDDQISPAIDIDVITPIEHLPLQKIVKLEQIDFLGVDNFNVAYHPFFLKFINNLKVNLVRNMRLVEFKIRTQQRQLRYSKYLILWHGCVQFLTECLKWDEMLILIALRNVINVWIFRDESE